MKSPITLIALFLFTLTGYSNHLIVPSTVNPPATLTENPVDPNVKGYTYNLVALKGESIGGASTLDFSGRIFLDGRKGYKANFKKKEHFNFENFTLTDGKVYKIPGEEKVSTLIKHKATKDYYVALKLGNAWSQYYYEDIMENRLVNVGSEIGLKNCNFKKEMFDYDNSWRVTAYFEIKPIYYDASKAKDANTTIYVTTQDDNTHMPELVDY